MDEKCECIEKIEDLTLIVDRHTEDLKSLKSFKEWSEPLLKTVSTMKETLKWMTIIFAIYVGISAYIYTKQIFPFMEKISDDKIEIIEIIHDNNIKMMEQLSDLKVQVVTSSKINYKATKNIIEKEVRRVK